MMRKSVEFSSYNVIKNPELFMDFIDHMHIYAPTDLLQYFTWPQIHNLLEFWAVNKPDQILHILRPMASQSLPTSNVFSTEHSERYRDAILSFFTRHTITIPRPKSAYRIPFDSYDLTRRYDAKQLTFKPLPGHSGDGTLPWLSANDLNELADKLNIWNRSIQWSELGPNKSVLAVLYRIFTNQTLHDRLIIDDKCARQWLPATNWLYKNQSELKSLLHDPQDSLAPPNLLVPFDIVCNHYPEFIETFLQSYPINFDFLSQCIWGHNFLDENACEQILRLYPKYLPQHIKKSPTLYHAELSKWMYVAASFCFNQYQTTKTDGVPCVFQNQFDNLVVKLRLTNSKGLYRFAGLIQHMGPAPRNDRINPTMARSLWLNTFLQFAKKNGDSSADFQQIVHTIINSTPKMNIFPDMIWQSVKPFLSATEMTQWLNQVIDGNTPVYQISSHIDMVLQTLPAHDSNLKPQIVRRLLQFLSSADSDTPLETVFQRLDPLNQYIDEQTCLDFIKRYCLSHPSSEADTIGISSMLKHFTHGIEFKKKVTDFLSDALTHKNTELSIANLQPLMKQLMIGKTHPDKSSLALPLQIAHKMMWLTPDEASYLDDAYYPQELLDKNFTSYHKLFSYLSARNNSLSTEVLQNNPHFTAQVTDILLNTFHDDVYNYLHHVQKFLNPAQSSSFLPTNIHRWKSADVQSLSDWLMRNIIFNDNGKNNVRPLQELTEICMNWQKLTDPERMQSYKDLIMTVTAKSYPQVRSIPFAIEAKHIGLTECDYPHYEDMYLAAQSVPEPFPTKPRFKHNTLTGRFLPRSDARVASFGAYTDCCQKLGHVGEDCAVSCMLDPFAQCFAIEDSRGKIVAGSFVWKTHTSKANKSVVGVCFDNVEALGGYNHNQDINEIYNKAANFLVRNGAGLVTVGTSHSDIDVEQYPVSNILLKPETYQGYTDASKEQRVLASSASAPNPDPEKSSDLFMRPLLLSRAEDYRQANALFPFQLFPHPYNNLSVSHTAALLDLAGHMKAFFFAEPETNHAEFYIDPVLIEKNPQMLTAWWQEFLKRNASVSRYLFAAHGAETKRVFFELQKRNFIKLTPSKSSRYISAELLTPLQKRRPNSDSSFKLKKPDIVPFFAAANMIDALDSFSIL